MPATSVPGEGIVSPKGSYRPMALGPIGRNFADRVKLAGTYDAQWLDNVFPFLPKDFQPAYYQAAPPDQQIAYPRGGETINLYNLTPEGRLTFRLPTESVPILFVRPKHGDASCEMIIDIIAIDGEARKLYLTWRASLPLKKNMFEIKTVVFGTPTRGWQRARKVGKTHYRSLRMFAAQGEPVQEVDPAILEDTETEEAATDA